MGKISKVYGILGWLNFFSFTENKEKIFSYIPWFVLKNQVWEIIEIKNWKRHNNHFIIQIKNIQDRLSASKWTNTKVYIDKISLPKLKKNEYYWNDIIKCKVFDTKNKYIGIVINLISQQYNDVLVIENKFKKLNNTQIMIPFIIKKIIKSIDINNKIIIVQWN